MEIQIDRRSPVPIYLQITNGIKEMILKKKLPGGFRLPPERRLARSLGINRSTVLNAYRELKADGLVDAHVGQGTTVVPQGQTLNDPETVQPLPWRQLIRDSGSRNQDPLIRDLLELTEQRDVISLSIGLPAPELLPLQILRDIQDRLVAELGAAVLLHSPTEGITSFRETLCQQMTIRGIRCSLSDVLVTSGSQQGLDLVIRTLINPGDEVVVEEPSYFGALEAFRGAQARLLGIPTDAEGMRTDILESVLARHRPKLIYTLPTFQNPSGCVLSLQRRRLLLALAYRYQVPVLEDDPYSELRYEGDAIPSLKALDPHGFVLYLSSFSKILFPGLRMGWLAGPRSAIRELALNKQTVDLHSNTFGQWIIDRFIREGHLARHIRSAREEYARRRDVMIEALSALAPPGFTWTKPEGGFYVWCRFSGTVSPRRLMEQAAIERVSFLPGAPCFAGDVGENYLRLNFTMATPEQIREGVRRLSRALRAAETEPRNRDRTGVGTPPIV